MRSDSGALRKEEEQLEESDALLDHVDAILDSAAKRMTREEFQAAQAKAKSVIDGIRARVASAARSAGKEKA